LGGAVIADYGSSYMSRNGAGGSAKANPSSIAILCLIIIYPTTVNIGAGIRIYVKPPSSILASDYCGDIIVYQAIFYIDI
jgi:hypothetical protein